MVTTASSRQRPLSRGRRQPRRLVHLEPEAVAQRVAERLAEAARRDDVAGQRVGLAARHPGPELLRRALRCASRTSSYIVRWRVVGRAPDHHRAGEVGAVSVDLRAEVDQQPFPPADRPRAWCARAAAPLRGPEATIVWKGCHSLPRRRSAASSRAGDLAAPPRPTRTVGSTSASAACASSAAARIAATSSGILDDPQPLDQLRVATGSAASSTASAARRHAP